MRAQSYRTWVVGVVVITCWYVLAPTTASAGGNPCTSDADCLDPSRPVCVNGFCQPLEEQCQSDADCLDPLLPVCDTTSGLCIAMQATPTATATATPTATATLVPDGGSCSNASECESGFCDGGTCAEVTSPAPAISGTGLYFAAATLVLVGSIATIRRRRRT